MASDSKLSLQTLFTTALQDASKSFEMTALQAETQDLINSSLRNLKLVMRGIELSGMFSPNETLDDLTTSSIPYLALDYIAAELIERLRTTGHEERIRHIVDTQRHLHVFSELVRQYGIVSKQDQQVFEKKLSEVKDPSSRRDLKIRQFKVEKEAKNRLEALFRRTQPSFSSDSDNDIIRAMLPPSKLSSEEANEHADEEGLRETYLLVIRLIWMRSQAHLEPLNNELELLRAALSSPSSSSSQPKPPPDTTWRLDPPIPTGGPDGRGPLLDSGGRPLRPFTLLPGNVSDRASLKANVFRPDHRLPTMTIDEYLDKEREMGNIITGGGPQSLNAPTEAEQLTIDAEMEGTLLGESRAEEKRQQDERWARYTDLHPKGEGNTMNRG